MRKIIYATTLFILLCSVGTYGQGTWSTVTNLAPDFNGGVMLLLTDGSVISKTYFGGFGAITGNNWDKLTPDATGNYANGTWSRIAPMADDRLYFSTWVLNDGRVFVSGGEYGAGSPNAEVYNPVTNTWTSVPTTGLSIGYGASENLPDGKILCAVGTGSLLENYIYNPGTNTFTLGPSCFNSHSEAAWLKLPDSSILQVDIFNYSTERYIPSTNTWIADDSVPVMLYDSYGFETGSAVLLPDGRGFFVGATGKTAYYTPSGNTSHGTWAAGPDLPTGLGAPDAALSMLNNGKILLALSPQPTALDHFPSTLYFYEFDYLTNTYTLLGAPGGGGSIGISAYNTNMLSLPDGKILYANQGSKRYYLFTPDGTPLAAGKPSVDSIIRLACDTFQVTGKLFTGISEGASYGDDWAMSTNFPLVRLTSGTTVKYARTYNWNRFGSVMTGTLPDTLNFIMPTGLPPGTYSLQVVVNGIASTIKTFNNSLSITPSTINICMGNSTTLTDSATIGFWSSSNASIATIGSATGIVNSVAAGTANITYSIGSCFKVASLTVNPLPSSIGGTTTVCAGSTTTLSSGSAGGTWSSNNPSIATAGSGTGVVSGIASGNTTITYTLPTTCYTTTSVTVNPLPASISGTSNVCVGSSITLTDATAGGNWSTSAAGIATINASTGVANGISAGTAIITYTLPTGCITTATITVNPLPSAISGSLTICPSSSTTLTDAGGGIWASSATGVAIIGSATGIVTGISFGTTNITYTLPTGCIATTAFTVNANPAPITGAGMVCETETITLTDAGGGTWTSGATGVATIGSSSGVVTGVSAGTATVTYTLGTGCNTTTVVTVNSIPGAVSGTTSICEGLTTALTGAGGGTWSSSATGVATIGSASGIASGITAGTSVINYTLANGCSSSAVVTINSSPAAISGTFILCELTTTILSDAGGGTWTSSAPGVATIGSSTGLVTGVTSGTATITYTLANGCITTSVVTVNPNPGAISGSTAICDGLTSTFIDAGGGTWSSSASGVASVGSASGIVTGVSPGTANITYTLTNGCSTNTTVTINNSPLAISGTLILCESATTTLTDAGGGIWTSSAAGVATIGSSSGIVSGIASGTTTITYTLANGCNTTANMTVNPLPGVISGSTNLCSGQTTTLTDAGGGVWSSSATSVATIGSSTGIVSSLSAGTTNITYTLATGCLTATTLTVNPLPASITGTTSLFLNTSSTLNNVSSGGSWSSSNAAIVSAGSATGIISGVSGGTAIISYILPTGCYAIITATVTNSPAPLTGATNVCQTSTTTFSSASTSGTWTSSNTGIASVGSTTGLITGVGVGSAIITYTIGGTFATKAITVNPPAAAITGSSSLCAGTSIVLSDATGGGVWSSSNISIATIGSSTGVINGITAGTATITYLASCGTAVTYPITVNPLPSAGTITGGNGLCLGGTTTLSDAAPGGIWSTNSSIATVGSATGVVTGLAISRATITYTVTNVFLCTSSTTKTLLVEGAPGNINTFAGTGTNTYTGDGAAAYLATLSGARDICSDASGNIYICDITSHVVRKVATNGIITTVAGIGSSGATGDGGQATAASLNQPNGVFVDNSGNIFIVTSGSHAIRKVNGSTGIITTIAGTTGVAGYGGDGGPATAAKFQTPGGICGDVAGNLYVCDQLNYRVRKIAAGTGIITTIAGNGSNFYSGDGGQGTAARMSTPRGITIDNSGNLYIVDALNNVIRKLSLATGIITTIAGTNIAGSAGDGGPATAAQLNNPSRIAYDGGSSVAITDLLNQKIRQVNIVSNTIRTLAGTGVNGFSGDNGPAISGNISGPTGVAFDNIGNMYFSDANNKRIRVVNTWGSICISLNGPTTVATGTPVTFTAKASITQNVTYQWQKNGSNVGTGLTTYTNPTPANGDVYRCIQTINPACGSAFNDTSNSITITVTGPPQPDPVMISNSYESSYIKLFPNPVHDNLVIEAIDFEGLYASVNITDQLGKSVMTKKINVANNAINESLDLSSLPDAVYLVTIINESGKIARFKLVKN